MSGVRNVFSYLAQVKRGPLLTIVIIRQVYDYAVRSGEITHVVNDTATK